MLSSDWRLVRSSRFLETFLFRKICKRVDILRWTLLSTPTMRSYGREELLQLRRDDVTPPRPLRKAIFSLGIWLPRHRRNPPGNPPRDPQRKQQLTTNYDARSQPSMPSSDQSTPKCVSSSSSVKFGLLNARSVGNKSVNIASLITEESYDAFFITETWHTATDDVALRRCVPNGFSCIDRPRPTTDISSVNHGGVAAVVSERFRCKQLTSLTSFESLLFADCTYFNCYCSTGISNWLSQRHILQGTVVTT